MNGLYDDAESGPSQNKDTPSPDLLDQRPDRHLITTYAQINEGPSYDTDIHPENYVPDSADFLPSPPSPPSPMARFPAARSLKPAMFLLALCFATSLANWTNALPIGGTWASYETVWNQGQWWRLFTSLLTHANLAHLLSNTPLFLIFGWYLRDFFGFAVFPGAALAIGVLSNAWTLWTYPPDTELLGASGMLYGMVALWLVLYVHFETKYTRPQRIFRAIGVSLLLLFPTSFQQTTSYTAHGSGFILGLLVGVITTPFIRLRTRPEEQGN
jgi:rhomboid protease GluP